MKFLFKSVKNKEGWIDGLGEADQCKLLSSKGWPVPSKWGGLAGRSAEPESTHFVIPRYYVKK